MTVEHKYPLVEDLAANYGSRLRRFLRTRVRNRADIPDIIQEVYLRLLRVPQPEMIRAPEAYIFTVAQHAARQHSLHLTAQGDRIDLSEMLEELHAHANSAPDMHLSATQCLAILDRTLRAMSPNMQSAFLLHKRDGLTIDQVSAQLGISRPMTKKYLVKALIRFRQSLKDNE